MPSSDLIPFPSLPDDEIIVLVDDALDNEIVVVFDMWGQRCVTTFNGTSELTHLDWLRVTFEKGWLLPIEIYQESTGIVLYDRDELEKMFKEG